MRVSTLETSSNTKLSTSVGIKSDNTLSNGATHVAENFSSKTAEITSNSAVDNTSRAFKKPSRRVKNLLNVSQITFQS